ncbi:hypothetical protein ABT214_03135 [Micromonospora purpureochromogenes]|uniref:hypothetical protein n=1 Tax=Micromonospora purpureochromogenes TaxID=47872 RepID=UPI00331DB2E4
MEHLFVQLLLGVLAVAAIFLAVGLGVALLTHTPLTPPTPRRSADERDSAHDPGPI